MEEKEIYRKGCLLCFVPLVFIILSSTTAFGAVIRVPGDHSTIQAGIDAASNGDTVSVADGTYVGPGNVAGGVCRTHAVAAELPSIKLTRSDLTKIAYNTRGDKKLHRDESADGHFSELYTDRSVRSVHYAQVNPDPTNLVVGGSNPAAADLTLGVAPSPGRIPGDHTKRFVVPKMGVETAMANGNIPPPPGISETFLDEGDYYLVRGKKVFIRRDAHRMVVKFKDNTFANLKRTAPQPEEQTLALHSALSVSDAEMSLSIERQFDKRMIAIIQTYPKSGKKLLRSRIQDFNTSASVEYAYPLFVTKTGIDELVLTDEIIARFSPEHGEQEVGEFCTQNGLFLIRKTRGRLNVYLLRLNDPKSRSCLEVANSLNDKQGIIWAEPNFLSRIKLYTSDSLYNNLWHLNNTGQGGEQLMLMWTPRKHGLCRRVARTS